MAESLQSSRASTVKREMPMKSTAGDAAAIGAARLTSLDAYRGFIMLLMISAGLYMSRVAKSFPDSGIWQFLGYQTDHAMWRGCTLWDLIQPSFMFMVGVALPFSIANRQASGQQGLKLRLQAGKFFLRKRLIPVPNPFVL